MRVQPYEFSAAHPDVVKNWNLHETLPANDDDFFEQVGIISAEREKFWKSMGRTTSDNDDRGWIWNLLFHVMKHVTGFALAYGGGVFDSVFVT